MTEHNTTAVLRRLRFSRGMSQTELAKQAGCSLMTVWTIEMCRHKRGAHAPVRAALERIFDVPYDVLAAPDTENASAGRRRRSSLASRNHSGGF